MATFASAGLDVGGLNDGDTTYVAGNNYSVQHCHDQFASSGDTVTIPNGTFTWATGVSITKSITLAGTGYTPNTAINASSPGAPTLATIVSYTNTTSGNNAITITSASTGTNTFRMTGISFIGISSSVGTTVIKYFAVSGSKTTDEFRIDNCSFDTSSHQEIMGQVSGDAPGLIDHCTFNGGGASEMIHNIGLGAGNQNGWLDDITPGSRAMFFIEDCIFQLNGYTSATGQLGTCGIQSYYGARNVLRYNLLNFAEFDQHGNNDVNTRWFEFYNNQLFIPSTNTGNTLFLGLRGGSGVVFNNTLAAGSQTSIGAVISLYTDEAQSNNLNPAVSGTQPGYGPGAGIFSAAGTGQGPTSSPVYIWGTGANITISSSTVGVGGWSPSPITINNNYFVSTTQPSSMTISQKASQIPPTTYSYTPFTYPHPLTGLAINPSLTPGSIKVSGVVTPTLVFVPPTTGVTAAVDASIVRTLVGAASGTYIVPANNFVALYTTRFSSSKAGATEFTTTGYSTYARQAMGAAAAGWTINAYANGIGVVWSNTNNIIFPTIPATGTPQMIHSIGFCDALTAGNIDFFIDLLNSITVPVGINTVLPASTGAVFTTY